jgi:hypothetical protein
MSTTKQTFVPYYESVKYTCQNENVIDLPCIDKAMETINENMIDCTKYINNELGNMHYLRYCDFIKRYDIGEELLDSDRTLYRKISRKIEQNMIFPIYVCNSISMKMFKSSTDEQNIYMYVFHTRYTYTQNKHFYNKT